MKKAIKIIDLFAGPGGLGEGFSAYQDSHGHRPFKIALSIENDPYAHATLTLRSFYRQFEAGCIPGAYADFLAGRLGSHPENELFRRSEFRRQVQEAKAEARLLTLGKDTRAVNSAITDALGGQAGPWVLIGGPPCQAYSLVGRARNKGIANYKPEEDHRNFLYREYLKVLARFKPDVFVMENVKGMLSANVAGRNLFSQILDDLRCPARALRTQDKRTEYQTVALGVTDGNVDLFGSAEPSDYVLRAERFGVPQMRHRVIILGIRSDHLGSARIVQLHESAAPSISEVIGDLPKCRSGLSRERDSLSAWVASIKALAPETIKAIEETGRSDLAHKLEAVTNKISRSRLNRGSSWSVPKRRVFDDGLPQDLADWYSSFGRTNFVINHDTRGHRADDLQRYLFCSSFSACAANGGHESPKRSDFPQVLYPNHKSWDKGDFADRFRVQAKNRVATTITSHIAKDGHYFIHYDPLQCRSLTVREAARVQTFPDDYFFVGPRTEQYRQVGNAVPPYLAKQLAMVVLKAIRR